MTTRDRYFIGGDEAGNPKGSDHFVVSLVATQQPRVIADRLKLLRRERHLRDDFIFAFHETTNAVRRAFLAAVQPMPVRVWALVVDKSRLAPQRDVRRSLDIWGEFVTDLVLRLPQEVVAGAIITLHDYDNPRRAERQLRQILSLRITDPKGRAKKVRCRPKRSQALVQCADMLAGSIRRYYSLSDPRFYNLTKNKLEDLWEF